MNAPHSTILSVDETARRRFEADRKSSAAIAFEAYLPPDSDPRFVPTLEELVLIDLEWSWKTPDGSAPPKRVEEYVARFERLREPAILSRLVAEEYRLRHRFGDRPAADEYRDRFPTLDIAKLTAQTVEYVGPANADATPTIPGYSILEQLGRGGMGLVFLARQDTLNRVVALKLIRGRAADALDRARFKLKAEAAAALNHPNIVQVHEVGEADGQPYLAMEHVSGGTLDRALGGMPQTPRLAAETVERLARAVRAAHAAGVLHRDLKPANILLAPAESGSLPWTPKVGDFGLAKRIGEAGQTESGAVLGTPSYMAPEQAAGRKEIGPAADVYGLGAILYEMLAGRPPFRAATSFDTVVQVINEEPVPPSRFVPKLPRDVETICLKCLEKDPSRRYPDAAELAADLRRFLNDEPIAARRIGSVERAARWVKRRPTAAGLLAALVVAVVATSVGAVALHFNGRLQTAFENAESQRIEADEQRSIAASQRSAAEESAKEANHQRGVAETNAAEAAKQKAEAERQRERAEQFQYYAQVRLAQQAWNDGDVPRTLELLDRYLPVAGRPDRRHFEWHFVRRLTRNLYALRGHQDDVNGVAYSSDGRRVASTSYDNTVKIWDAIDGRLLKSIKPPAGSAPRRLFEVAFHPAGDRVAVTYGPVVALIHLDKLAATTFTGHRLNVNCLAFDAAGRRLVTGSVDGTAIIWDVASGQRLATIAGEPGEIVSGVAFHPNGEQIVWSSRFDLSTPLGPVSAGKLKAWDLATKSERFRQTWFGFLASNLAIHPAGDRVAVALRDGTVREVNWADGTERRSITAHERGVTAVRYTPDGSLLASTGYDLAIRFWDDSGNEALTLRGHSGRPVRDKTLGESSVMQLAFSPDGLRLASCGDDRSVMIWDVSAKPTADPPSRPNRANTVYSVDRKLLAYLKRPTIQIRDADTDEPLVSLPVQAALTKRIWFSPRGDRVVAEYGEKEKRHGVRVWDLATGHVMVDTPVPEKAAVEISDDGRFLFAFTEQIQVWSLEAQEVVHLPAHKSVPIRHAAVNPAGTMLAAIPDYAALSKKGWDPVEGEIPIWSLKTGQLVSKLYGHAWSARDAAWHPEGQALATCSQDETIRIWDPLTGKFSRGLLGHKGTIYAIAYSRDGKRFFSCGQHGTVRIWDPELAEEILTLGREPAHVWELTLDPQEDLVRTKAGATESLHRRIWDGRPPNR